MKTRFVSALFAGLILAPCFLIAQAPAGAPAGTTGKCKDGSFTSQATKQGACRGHKGVDTWYAADTGSAKSSAKSAAPAATPAPAAAPAPAPKQTAAPAASAAPASTPKSSGSRANKTPAPGGGPGLVWVNSGTNVYHCYGTEFYGTTKAGKYMSEADAKAAGARPERNKPCSAK
ncbi:hypothetical protein [Occallatibacter savannae]|uniref:hypothetical protein n=1 Tax=Occallatibacter savannae TaxID=1002691 RepID=UPI0013A55A48|nr:hypothetical protein [Occallatibacter savannae]